MSSAHKTPAEYLIKLAITVFAVSSTVLFVNWLVDPLWYFQGNRLFPENYSFNERHAKVNLYLKEPKKYDCILFGSSRTTLLDATKINNFNCFNFAFSDGSPSEFVDYAKYIKTFGKIPDLVIVGIDGRNFSRNTQVNRTPDFVLDFKKPPHKIKTYLSIDAFLLSLRTLIRDTPRPRYYTNEFIGDVLQGTPDFSPPSCFNINGYSKPFTLKNAHFYRTLKSIFPEATFIGYVAPISAWDMLAPYQDGTLPSYLKTIYRFSKLFDKFYDFAVPSRVTKRVDNNYDGHHYSRAVNDQIALAISNNNPTFGLSLHDRSFDQYKAKYNHDIETFAAELDQIIPFDKNCPRTSTVR